MPSMILDPDRAAIKKILARRQAEREKASRAAAAAGLPEPVIEPEPELPDEPDDDDDDDDDEYDEDGNDVDESDDDENEETSDA